MFLPCSGRKGSAYFEFQYCKKTGKEKKLMRGSGEFWKPDSLIVNVYDMEKLLSAYSGYLKSPCGASELDAYGINYYTKEQTQKILNEIKEDKPEDHETLADWLEKAANDYNGFYFVGI